jgi:murein DD-endopeptidase MepM/ murein hydrolase activator NlpD
VAGKPSCDSQTCGGQGNFVEVMTDEGWYYRYMHLSAVSAARGARVGKGQALGRTGNTGHSTGPHLHLEAYASSSRRSETIFNALCLYDLSFVSGLSFDATGNCDAYKDGSAAFSPGSAVFQQQCSEMRSVMGT